MGRPTTRRKLQLEGLESREVLSSGGPSAQAQYMLEVMNLVRTNPVQGADWVQQKADGSVKSNLQYYGVDLNNVKNEIASAQPREPLAWNGQLANAAQGQSNDMAQNGFQSHTGSDGRDLGARLDSAGYNDRTRATENAFAYSLSVDNAMQAFLIDWGVADKGHRRNLLDTDTTAANASSEVGLGIATTTKPGFGPLVITQDFGSRNGQKAQLVGTVYDDRDNDGRYSMNEGVANASVDVTNLQNGQTQNVTTWDAGGYQLPLDPGNYAVTARSNGRSLGTRTININDQNVKVDFNAKTAAPVSIAPVAVSTARSAPPVVSTPPVVGIMNSKASTPAPVTVTAPKVTVTAATTPVSAPTTPAKVTVAAVDSVISDEDWSADTADINWYSAWDAK